MRVAVVAEWYPSPADPVLGIWAHRQAQAARAAGADVRVLAMRRPLPPLAAARAALSLPPRLGPLREWAAGVGSSLRPWELDGVPIEPVAWAAPPRPLSYGVWGRWMAPPLARALDALHARWPFDLLHAHCVTPPGYAAARWLERRRGAPGRPALVVSAHGPDMIHVYRRSRWARRDAERALRAADVVAANSAWAANRCEQIARGPLPARVLHLGADLPPARQPEARSGEPFTVATVAHLVERKRHALVLRALARLPRERPWAYEVIGEGPCRAPLEALAAELGIADRVRFRGQLDHPDALAALAACDLFAMPGVEEPFGVAFVEAMAAGLPAIGTAGEGGPEDIAAAGPGLELVPRDGEAAVDALAERLAALAADRAAAARLGAAARTTVERCFTWERCGAATVDLYREAAARAAGAAA
ncbi:glycosyltransferase [Conexibacter arvalis]|uniref:Glycosyltransferase involved in cell wall biosynthesis n=1 Tax=Conexibacter arvalis TaxID=912552 RepID=A0A840IC16_9ACTN|nr:glycosyltransferase [Conexibacter arvalis]MBB4661763.1 glycosyltransferase involved in cell wall biosynthesis [Conexibacter arvalis]